MSGARTKASVLDNKETLLQFSKDQAGTQEQKNAFITAYYKRKNLRLADKLETSTLSENKAVNTAIRYLRYCGSLSVVEVDQNNSAEIFKTSKSCKNPHCALCSRAKSNKLAMRFLDAIKDKGNYSLFKGVHFYFLTLTLRHGKGVREEVYLNELNKYCNKLFRSKVWSSNFEVQIAKEKTGKIHTRECTFSDSGYHIHAHIIIAGSRLRKSVKDVENDLKAKWLKITKDSFILRLDLLKFGGSSKVKLESSLNDTAVIRALKELFKYGTKTGALVKWKNSEVEKYADWIVKTKGKNFVNVSGVFRGLKLTSAKCKYDNKPEAREVDFNSKYYISKTSQLLFSSPTHLDYSTKKRKEILDKVCLKQLPSSAMDITEDVEEMLTYMTVGIEDMRVGKYIKDWVEFTRKEGLEMKRHREEVEELLRKSDERKKREKSQLKIFNIRNKA